MTYEQLLLIRPGDIIRTIKTRKPRLVLSDPGRTTKHGVCIGLTLMKIGRSWTDPNPTASYDSWAVRQLFEPTGRRGCSEALALEWNSYWVRRFHAKIAGQPSPRAAQVAQGVGPAPYQAPHSVGQETNVTRASEDEGRP